MAKKKRFIVKSPDGFPISRDETYSTKEKAIKAFHEWKKRYEFQGYYSSNNGRIALDDLENYCQIVEL
jgi:hypothetical protein